VIDPLKVTVGLPPETKNTAPVPPMSEPPCMFRVPLAVVTLTHASGSPVLSALTEVSTMASGEPVTLTAGASVVEIVPLADVVVPVLLARLNAATAASGAISRSAKVTAPALVPRLTPAPADVLEVVLPKFIVPPALVFVTEMPMPVGLVVVVVPMLALPLTRSRVTPVVVLLVEETLVKLRVMGVAGTAALVMLIAGPLVDAMLPAAVVTVIDPVLPAPTRPLPFEVVIARLLKVTLPTLPVAAPPKFTPVPALPLLTVVAANVTAVPVARL